MRISDIQKYLIATFAGYFIGIGSGFLTLAEYMFDRDKEAAKHTIEFESLSSINIDKIADCGKAGSYKEKCKYAKYLHDSNTGIWEALEFIANILMYIGLGCLGTAGTIEIWRRKS